MRTNAAHTGIKKNASHGRWGDMAKIKPKSRVQEEPIGAILDHVRGALAVPEPEELLKIRTAEDDDRAVDHTGRQGLAVR